MLTPKIQAKERLCCILPGSMLEIKNTIDKLLFEELQTLLELNKMKVQKYHVYALKVFLCAWVEDGTTSDWAHMATLFFQRHEKGFMCMSVSISPIKTKKAKGTFNRIYSEEMARNFSLQHL